MMQSSFTVQKTPQFSILSSDQVYEIHRATLEVLEKTGYKVMCPEARSLLKQSRRPRQGRQRQDPTAYCRSVHPDDPQRIHALRPGREPGFGGGRA